MKAVIFVVSCLLLVSMAAATIFGGSDAVRTGQLTRCPGVNNQTFNVTSFILNPNPPVPGRRYTVTIFGNLLRTIVSSEINSLRTSQLNDNSPVDASDQDLCDVIGCPQIPGPKFFFYSDIFPATMTQGEYLTIVRARAEIPNIEISCILRFTVPPPAQG
eukprot:TRINITY_DN1145_c0_g1_i1.p1 TRINITY_DN1145_c0_g1~~TRINITY_DN1145_c0_g1_i1.p1  ORF type:complete len:160 (+),score=24.22 TRINITY_DN1145_c0_g1_i1:37-516(+)